MKTLKDKRIEQALRCPVCDAQMCVSDNGASLVCLGAKKHCYDFSASGYVNLCPPSGSGGGDSKEAVRARTAFLNTGIYEPVAKGLRDTLVKYCSDGGLAVDAGCGEGYYSAFAAKSGFSVFGADVSKFAVDAAAKRASRIGLDNTFFAAASVFELPLGDGTADAVINVFAPCAEKEYSRVLRSGGVLVVAWAGEKHLLGLKRAIYDNPYENIGRADLPTGLKKLSETHVSYETDIVGNEQIMSLFSMTPYYWRTSSSDKDKLLRIERLTTEIDVVLSVYEK